MKAKFFRRLSLGVAAAVMLGAWGGTADAAPSLSRPGEEIEKSQPQADAKVESNLPAAPEAPEVRFTISNVRLDAQELKLNKEVLARILSQSVGVETTLSLTNPRWALQKVKKTETDSEHEQIMPSADEEEVGLATIYVVPAEGATSQFFKLEAK